MYPMRLKGISICFTMLKAALCGNYVNFGVCKLYGDETLENVLDVTTKLILTIPQSDLMVKYKKSAFNCHRNLTESIFSPCVHRLGVSKAVTILFHIIGELGPRSYVIFVNT